MTRIRRATLSATILLLTVAASAWAATPLLGLSHIGPLRIGMTRTAAIATGWLAHRSPGCELAGTHRPIDYTLTGSSAPSGIRGSAEFYAGRLTSLSFSHGVTTTLGVTPGTTTITQMVSRYRHAGDTVKAQYDSTFRGTFVTVTKHGKTLIGAFGEHKTITTLAIPNVGVCE